MKIKVDKFCTLSTSPSWQAWLFHFDAELYRTFIKKLQNSRGCNQNRDIMTDTLNSIAKIGGNDKLIEFLTQHYPYVLINENSEPVVQSVPVGGDEIFEHYNPAILTYPHRLIITGDDLQKKVRSFLLDKIKSDFVIIGDKAYVEFLNRDERDLVESIPAKNWIISQWRLRHE